MRPISFFHPGWRRFDWLLLSGVSLLTILGLASIYSIDLSRGTTLSFFPTQLLAAALGLGVVFFLGRLHVSMFQSTAFLAYLFSIILLVAVLFFGETIRGTTGWFRVAGFSFQPAEFAKVAFILFFAMFIYRRGRSFDRWSSVLGSALWAAIPAGLIFLQPDLGSSLVIIAIWFGMLCFTNIKRRYIVAIVVIGIFLITIGWFFFLKEYQKDRLTAFVHPNNPACAETTCYNVRQSLIAIGAGQLRGRGLGFGSQSQLHFLPEAQTDFIFAVIAEELGFLGAGMLLVLYALILYRLISLAQNATNDFAAYTVMGIACLFLFQVAVNIGATTGIVPVTGLTLPFVSYGGSSLIINFLLVGIVESVAWSASRMRNDVGVPGLS